MNNNKPKTVTFDIAERYLTKCYLLNGVTYVPHRNYSGFAYPGMTKQNLPVSGLDLIKTGAKAVEEWLYGSTVTKTE